MPAPIDLSIIIVGYQVRDHLQRCLASLRALRPSLSLEILVVDNASTDGSAELVAREFPHIKLIRNEKNVGFARANNQGLAQAHGRYLMLLNPDTEIQEQTPNALVQLVSFMDSHPRAGVCGPRLVYQDGSHQHSAFHFPSLLQVYLDLFPTNWRIMESRLNGRYPSRWYERGQPFEVHHPLGAALLVRRATLQQVGLLDEDYFIYVEEVDWCYRIQRAGWEIWCVPSAVVVHHEARSTRQFREKMFVELWKARLTYYRKHFSPLYNSLVRRLVILGMSRAEAAARTKLHGQPADEELQARLKGYACVRELARSYSKQQSVVGR